MGASDQILITLAGEGPWGFRLQGGAEKKLPLQVSKVRKRSKACRGGLREKDEMVSINGKSCDGLSHAAAMQLIDSSSGRLQICVKRTPAAATGEQRGLLSPTPGVQAQKQKQLRPLQPPTSPDPPRILHRESITSPPDSEAYYGETDSDADTLGQRPQEITPIPHEKHRRARKKSPRSPPEPQSLSEMSGYDSAPEPVRQVQHKEEDDVAPKPSFPSAPWRSAATKQHLPAANSIQSGVVAGGGVAKREIVYEPSEDSRAETPFSDVDGGFYPAEEGEGPAPSPEALLLPQGMARSIRAERPLIPMVGPVEHPVDEDLTTSYMEKAKEAMLHRSESVQDKQVKEAKTKCKTIASLLTDAPNPHSKGVLMFKKRRQRAKKYTLVSYGSVDEDRYEDEDGIFPTSESEFDEEGFSDARSLTNQSDWDNTYMDIDKPKMDSQSQQEEQGLCEESGRGAKMFEQLRQKASESAPEQAPHPTQCGHQSEPNVSKKHMMMNGEGPAPQDVHWGLTAGAEDSHADPAVIFNRSARPFTPGVTGHRPVTTSVIFRPSTPKKKVDSPSARSIVPSPFTVTSPAAVIETPGMETPPSSTKASLYISGPSKQKAPLTPKLSVEEIALESTPTPTVAKTTTASIYLSNPSRQTGSPAAANHPTPIRSLESTQKTPGASSTLLVISPTSKGPNPVTVNKSYVSVPKSSVTPIASSQPPCESLTSREQRIAVPASRTGILQEARKRGSRKQMFTKVEEKQKHSPNPELLSLVQNLDGKPKNEPHGAGFESGPEEDFLSLGAEACNFMQSNIRKLKAPPPVAPKPHPQFPAGGQVNGTHDMPQMGGKGAELFAKRQSRMDRFVVESTPAPYSRPRTPSPTPSLPSGWKYSSNIRAPPPIAYNPLHSPFYPLAASKSRSSKSESKVKKATSQKPRLQAIDFMRHQPYQLNSAMFCYGGSPNANIQNPAGQVNQTSSISVTPARQAPVKTVRTYEVKRFSTPTPMSSSTKLTPIVIKPRSATTLDEPIWRTEVTSPPLPSRTPPPAPNHFSAREPQQQKSSPDFRAVGIYSPLSPIISPQSSISGVQVARPRFSASRTGIQANVWRPASVHY
ncbi:synaptopodin 2-like protein [Ambystoma mexicanum]|uniref:synaptopodin 2-like protein n=1 Tax=Ambystoma mexicanum TaxID=8296 RepID=UPI0037E95BF3